MARIPYVDLAKAPPKVRETLEKLPVKLSIFRMMAHAETNFVPLLRLGTSILTEQQLGGKLRELAILRVAKLSKAAYEWTQHVPIAIACGATKEQVAALERGDVPGGPFDDDERLVLRFTDEVVRDVRASDATLEGVRKRFGERGVVELLLAVGFYMLIARLLETTGVDLDPPAEGILDQVKRASPGPK